jgi:hypothetical protein
MLKFAGRVSGNTVDCRAIFAGGEKVGENLPTVTIATIEGAIGVVSVRVASHFRTCFKRGLTLSEHFD